MAKAEAAAERKHVAGGRALRDVRKQLGDIQPTFASKVGTSVRVLRRYEVGEIRTPESVLQCLQKDNDVRKRSIDLTELARFVKSEEPPQPSAPVTTNPTSTLQEPSSQPDYIGRALQEAKDKCKAWENRLHQASKWQESTDLQVEVFRFRTRLDTRALGEPILSRLLELEAQIKFRSKQLACGGV